MKINNKQKLYLIKYINLGLLPSHLCFNLELDTLSLSSYSAIFELNYSEFQESVNSEYNSKDEDSIQIFILALCSLLSEYLGVTVKSEK